MKEKLRNRRMGNLMRGFEPEGISGQNDTRMRMKKLDQQSVPESEIQYPCQLLLLFFSPPPPPPLPVVLIYLMAGPFSACRSLFFISICMIDTNCLCHSLLNLFLLLILQAHFHSTGKRPQIEGVDVEIQTLSQFHPIPIVLVNP